jgi:alcohol dehydrogenase class IV
MKEIHRYSFPTQIFFGAGSRHLVAREMKARGCERPIIITDATIAALPFTTELQAELNKSGLMCGLHGGRPGNPRESDVQSGVAKYKAHGADGIIALGGGAAIDVAKAVAVMVDHEGVLFDYEDEREGARPILAEKIPIMVALPTTAGTGSEVGRSSVIAEDGTHFKRIIFSPAILPVAVFADPELTIGLPAGVTASTGMDALTHNIEARLARGFQPFCDGLAMEGIRLAAASLRDCVRFAREQTGPTPEHIRARGLLLNASMMGAVAFQKGLGVTHSLAHSLSTVNDLHHGLANGIMISYAMEFNAQAGPETEKIFTEMARLVRAPAESPAGFVDWLVQLKADVGMPTGLKSEGVKSEHLDELVKYAELDVCHSLNPREVKTEDFRRMYEAALAS